jgi:hypothetical protein
MRKARSNPNARRVRIFPSIPVRSGAINEHVNHAADSFDRATNTDWRVQAEDLAGE